MRFPKNQVPPVAAWETGILLLKRHKLSVEENIKMLANEPKQCYNFVGYVYRWEGIGGKGASDARRERIGQAHSVITFFGGNGQ